MSASVSVSGGETVGAVGAGAGYRLVVERPGRTRRAPPEYEEVPATGVVPAGAKVVLQLIPATEAAEAATAKPGKSEPPTAPLCSRCGGEGELVRLAEDVTPGEVCERCEEQLDGAAAAPTEDAAPAAVELGACPGCSAVVDMADDAESAACRTCAGRFCLGCMSAAPPMAGLRMCVGCDPPRAVTPRLPEAEASYPSAQDVPLSPPALDDPAVGSDSEGPDHCATCDGGRDADCDECTAPFCDAHLLAVDPGRRGEPLRRLCHYCLEDTPCRDCPTESTSGLESSGPPAFRTVAACGQCRKPVCQAHYRATPHRCADCAPALKRKRDDPSAPAADDSLAPRLAAKCPRPEHAAKAPATQGVTAQPAGGLEGAALQARRAAGGQGGGAPLFAKCGMPPALASHVARKYGMPNPPTTLAHHVHAHHRSLNEDALNERILRSVHHLATWDRTALEAFLDHLPDLGIDWTSDLYSVPQKRFLVYQLFAYDRDDARFPPRLLPLLYYPSKDTPGAHWEHARLFASLYTKTPCKTTRPATLSTLLAVYERLHHPDDHPASRAPAVYPLRAKFLSKACSVFYSLPASPLAVAQAARAHQKVALLRLSSTDSNSPDLSLLLARLRDTPLPLSFPPVPFPPANPNPSLRPDLARDPNALASAPLPPPRKKRRSELPAPSD